MNTLRRAFLKAGTAVLGALTLAKYTEPLIAMPDSSHEWIEDKGDFVIVRVPDFKTFADEVIDRPAIFLLGENAKVKHVDVKGYVNLYAPKGGSVTYSKFDASKMLVPRERSVMELKAKDVVISDCHFEGNDTTTCGIQFIDTSPKVTHFPDFKGDIGDEAMVLTTNEWRKA
jgi:hypothetical protein